MNATELQLKINALLAEYEKETGTIIERIELVKIETEMIGKPSRLVRTVRVFAQRQPGMDWL